MKLSNLLVLGSLTAIAVAFSSCAKTEDLFDNDAYVAQKNSEYEANFVKKYGAVDPNKSWDLTTNHPQYSFPTEKSSARAFTRNAAGTYAVAEGTFNVEQSVLQWCFEKIPAGKNNTGQGTPFYLTVPGNPFTIVPLFQGNASYYWELWMNVDGYDPIKIWSKGDGLSYVTGGEETPVGKGQAGIPKNPVPDQVKAPSFTFTGLTEGATMYFSLRRWSSYTAYTNDKDKNQYTELTSMSQKMLALRNCPIPEEVAEGNSVNIIGCEDAGDNDFEDLVFMAYGIPTVKEVETLDQTFTKRYMVEDLGDTDDFDFNDLVIDVSKTLRTTFTYEVYADGTKKLLGEPDGPTLIDEWAVVRAVGGTLDFTITIGSSSWKKSEHMSASQMRNTGWGGSSIDYNAVLGEFKIKNMDWDYDNNNVSIEVDGRGHNSGVQTIKFPKDGEIPRIIAVDKDKFWMKERDGVPDSWILNSSPQPNPGGSN